MAYQKDTHPEGLPDHVEYVDETLPRPTLDPSKYTHKVTVRMPDMGEGSGKVLRWYMKEGDVVLRVYAPEMQSLFGGLPV